jgi:hypothetical protein
MQVQPGDSLSLLKQRHHPFAYLTELSLTKEFAILATCKRLPYMVLRPGGFHI